MRADERTDRRITGDLYAVPSTGPSSVIPDLVLQRGDGLLSMAGLSARREEPRARPQRHSDLTPRWQAVAVGRRQRHRLLISEALLHSTLCWVRRDSCHNVLTTHSLCSGIYKRAVHVPLAASSLCLCASDSVIFCVLLTGINLCCKLSSFKECL